MNPGHYASEQKIAAEAKVIKLQIKFMYMLASFRYPKPCSVRYFLPSRALGHAKKIFRPLTPPILVRYA